MPKANLNANVTQRDHIPPLALGFAFGWLGFAHGLRIVREAFWIATCEMLALGGNARFGSRGGGVTPKLNKEGKYVARVCANTLCFST